MASSTMPKTANFGLVKKTDSSRYCDGIELTKKAMRKVKAGEKASTAAGADEQRGRGAEEQRSSGFWWKRHENNGP